MGIDSQVILSAVGGAAGAFIANFVNVDFKRWREGGSLAAALAGELRARETDWEFTARIVDNVKELGRRGYKMSAPRRGARTDRIFESAVSQLGLLGPATVTLVIVAYARAFDCREAFATFESKVGELEADQIVAACQPVEKTLAEARSSLAAAADDLELRAARGFFAWYFRKSD